MSDEYVKYLRGRALRHYRGERSLTAEELAVEVSKHGRPVTQASIYSIEHGRVLLSPEMALQFATVLNIPATELLKPNSEALSTEIEPAAFFKGVDFARDEMVLYDAWQVQRDLKALETELGLELEPCSKRERFLVQFEKVLMGLRRIVDRHFLWPLDMRGEEFRLLRQELSGTLDVVSTVRREVLQRYGNTEFSDDQLIPAFHAAQRKLGVVGDVLFFSIRAAEHSLLVFQSQCGAGFDFARDPVLESDASARLKFGDVPSLLDELRRLTQEFHRATDENESDEIRGTIAWSACSVSQALFFAVCSLSAQDCVNCFGEVKGVVSEFIELLQAEIDKGFAAEPSRGSYRIKVTNSHIKVRLQSIQGIVESHSGSRIAALASG